MLTSSELFHVHLQRENCSEKYSGCENPGPAHPGCQSTNKVQAMSDTLWQLVRVCDASWRREKSHEALLPSPAARRAGAAPLSWNGHRASSVPPAPATTPDKPGRARACRPANRGVAL